MTSAVPELLVELLSLAAYTLLAAAFTVGGVLAENASLEHLGGGDVMLAVWFAALGFVFLYAGIYAVGYQKLALRATEELAT